MNVRKKFLELLRLASPVRGTERMIDNNSYVCLGGSKSAFASQPVKSTKHYDACLNLRGFGYGRR